MTGVFPYRSTVGLAVALVALTLATYWPLRSCDFIDYDDPDYVTANSHVQAGLTTKGFVWALRSTEFANWHPLTWLSHMLDCELYGLNPIGHHFSNLLLHLANTLLLFGVLNRMTRAPWRSATVAALFGIHPLHIESVAWVSERKDVLSTFFFMLTLWTYVRYVELKSATRAASSRHVPSCIFYLLAIVCFILGLMSKPMLVTLPFVLLLLDYWPLRRLEAGAGSSPLATRFAWPLLREKLPFFALSVLSSVVTYTAQHSSGVVRSLEIIPLHIRLANAFVSYASYLGKTIWPGNLAIFYPYPDSWPATFVTVAGLLTAGLTIAAAWFARRKPYMTVGWFWYLGTLVPVIGLVQVGAQAMADRYTYVPLIGTFLMLVWGGGDLLLRWRVSPILLRTMAVSVIISCALRSAYQIRYWRSTEMLFQHAIKATQGNYVACNVLGIALERRGDLARAADCYTAALRLKPNFADAHSNLGGVLARQGNLDQAIVQFQQALLYRPNFCNALITLGGALTEQGRAAEAIAPLRKAIQLQDQDVDAHYNLGNAWLALARTNEASAEYQRVLALNSNHAPANFQLAGLLLSGDNAAAAVRHYRTALAANPHSPTIHYQLGKVLAATGQAAEGTKHHREAVRLRPDWPEPLNALAWLLATHPQATLRNGNEAVMLAESAAELTNHSDPQVLDTLAAAYAESGRFEDAIRTAAQAIKLTDTPASQHLAAEIKARLALYQRYQAFREPLPLTRPEPPPE